MFPRSKKGRSKMKRRTKKDVRDRLAKLARHCFSMEFNFGLASGIDRDKYCRLSSMANRSFWCEFYNYFGTDGI